MFVLIACCLPLPTAAAFTLGAVPQPGSLIRSEEQAVKLAAALQTALGEEVTVRIFTDEATLHSWLNRYQQVDLAVLTRNYVKHQPAGEFFVIHGAEAFGSLDPFVLRQGVTPRVRTKVQTAISSLAATPEVREIFHARPSVSAKAKPKPKPKPKAKAAVRSSAKPVVKAAVKPTSVAPAPTPARQAAETPTLPQPAEPTPPPVTPELVTAAPTVTSTAPRIWLEPTPEKTVEPTAIKTDQPVESSPQVQTTVPGAPPQTPLNLPEQPLPQPKTPAEPATSGNQRVWFAALLIGAALAGFLFWRSRRVPPGDSTKWLQTPSPAPVPTTAGKPAPHEEQPRETPPFTTETLLQAVAPPPSPSAELLPTAEETTDDTYPGFTKVAEPAPVEEIEGPSAPWSLENEYLPDASPEELPAPPAAPVGEESAASSHSPSAETDAVFFNGLGGGIAATADDEPEPRIEPLLAPKMTETFPSEENGQISLAEVENPFAEEIADYAVAELPGPVTDLPEAAEQTASVESAEEPVASEGMELDLHELPADAPFELESSALLHEPKNSEFSQTAPAEETNAETTLDTDPVDFYRETIFDFKPTAADAVQVDFSAAAQEDFPLETARDGERSQFALNAGELPSVESPDYSAFFDNGLGKPPAPHSMLNEKPRQASTSPEQPVSLRIRGELGTSQVPPLLKLISSQKKPGTLIVRTRHWEKRFYFRKGKLAGATSMPMTNGGQSSDAVVDSLGQLLVRQGHLTEDAWEKSKQLALRTFDSICAANSELPLETVKHALSDLVTELVHALILFPKGRFEFLAQKSPIPTQEDLQLDINELLKSAALQTLEWRELRKAIASLDTVMEFKPNGRKKIQHAKMPKHQERILDQIDGKRSVQKISYNTHMSELEVCKFLFVMDKSKIIGPVK